MSDLPLIADMSEEQIKLNILRFSWRHGCSISPEKNLEKYVERVKSNGHCACHNERLSCPCVEAALEVDDKGYCGCRLFVDNEYLKIIQARIMRKIQANPLYRPDK